jgi:hypothetical protein
MVYIPMDLESSAVQVGKPEVLVLNRMPNVNSVYSNRRDSLALKSRLLSIVDSPDYWKTLSSFVRGRCPKQTFDAVMRAHLCTPEARRLHNDLIRAVIFNAHFAVCPPSNVRIPRKCKTEERIATVEKKWAPGRIVEVRGLTQVCERIVSGLEQGKITVGGEAAVCLFGGTRGYLMKLFEKVCGLIGTELEERSEKRVKVKHVLEALASDSDLGSVVSPSIITKYGGLSR